VKYVLLMYADPAHTQAMTAGDRDMMARKHAALRAELTGSGELLGGAGPAYRADTTTLRLDGGAVATSHGALDNIHGSADRLLPGQVPGRGQGPPPSPHTFWTPTSRR